MSKITPFLWFDGNVEEAVNHYINIFKNSKVLNMSRMQANGPVFSASFELEGQTFHALNGGPMYQFTPAISMFVDCKTQEEVDELWGKLTEGGSESRCGWLVDKFGLSWQIIPSQLGKLMNDKNPIKAKNVMDAMLQMGKIDIKKLEEAHQKE